MKSSYVSFIYTGNENCIYLLRELGGYSRSSRRRDFRLSVLRLRTGGDWPIPRDSYLWSGEIQEEGDVYLIISTLVTYTTPVISSTGVVPRTEHFPSKGSWTHPSVVYVCTSFVALSVVLRRRLSVRSDPPTLVTYPSSMTRTVMRSYRVPYRIVRISIPFSSLFH